MEDGSKLPRQTKITADMPNRDIYSSSWCLSVSIMSCCGDRSFQLSCSLPSGNFSSATVAPRNSIIAPSRSQPLFVIVQLLGTPKKYSFKVKRSNRDSSALVRRVDLDKMRGGDLMYLL